MVSKTQAHSGNWNAHLLSFFHLVVEHVAGEFSPVLMEDSAFILWNSLKSVANFDLQ